MKRKAYTTGEVVMILAIIGLLFAILFPAFLSSRKRTCEVPLGSVSAESNECEEFSYLPLTATDIIDHGNDWWEFTLNGNRWLLHNDGYDQESLALIPKRDEDQ